jgi:beta-mannosidase
MREKQTPDWVVGHTDAADGEPERFVPATVPGAVQLDWARAEGWGDPHFGERFRDYRWMEDVHWVYRTRLSNAPPGDGQRLFFVCGGIDYRFLVRLAGRVLLEQEGMFTPVEVDLTDIAAPGDRLEVVIAPVPKSQAEPEDRSQANQSCKPAVSYGWDFHPRLIPSGIWWEAFLETRPADHVTQATLDYDLDADLTVAQLRLGLGVSRPGRRVTWRVLDPDGREVLSQTAALGGTRTEITGRLENVRLWWPHDQGRPELYRSELELFDAHGRPVDRHERRFGLRRVRLVMNEGAWDEPGEDAFPKSRSHPPITLEVNGRRIFCKGTNWLCPDIFPGRVPVGRYRELLTLAQGANLDLLRCWGGATVPHDAFFEICDELGLMVWQEFPLACNRYEGTPEYLAVLDQESRSIIRGLREHPSLVIWCGGNELFNAWSGMTDQDLALRLLNRNCFDLDPQRPFLPTAPVEGMAHGHYVFRDRHGREVFQILAEAKGTAYSEFGCPAPADVETLRATLPADELFPPRPGTSWQSHHAFAAWAPNSHLLLDVIEGYFGACASLEELVDRGQLLQAEGLKCLFEEARRQKPKASMALCWCLGEPWPAAANLSVIGWPVRPKPGLAAVAASCRPVLASARIARFVWHEGELFAPELWLLNDSPHEIPAGSVEAILELGGSETVLLRWDHPAVPANRNLAGPTLRQVLPRADADRMTLRLRCLETPERDSAYLLLYRPRPHAEASAARPLNM